MVKIMALDQAAFDSLENVGGSEIVPVARSGEIIEKITSIIKRASVGLGAELSPFKSASEADDKGNNSVKLNDAIQGKLGGTVQFVLPLHPNLVINVKGGTFKYDFGAFFGRAAIMFQIDAYPITGRIGAGITVERGKIFQSDSEYFINVGVVGAGSIVIMDAVTVNVEISPFYFNNKRNVTVSQQSAAQNAAGQASQAVNPSNPNIDKKRSTPFLRYLPIHVNVEDFSKARKIDFKPYKDDEIRAIFLDLQQMYKHTNCQDIFKYEKDGKHHDLAVFNEKDLDVLCKNLHTGEGNILTFLSDDYYDLLHDKEVNLPLSSVIKMKEVQNSCAFMDWYGKSDKKQVILLADYCHMVEGIPYDSNDAEQYKKYRSELDGRGSKDDEDGKLIVSLEEKWRSYGAKFPSNTFKKAYGVYNLTGSEIKEGTKLEANEILTYLKSIKGDTSSASVQKNDADQSDQNKQLQTVGNSTSITKQRSINNLVQCSVTFSPTGVYRLVSSLTSGA